MRTMKHWALAAAAAAALALAGCGGGGSGSSSTAPTTPTDPPPPSALSFATDLNNSVDALTTLSGDADEDGSALMMAKDASEKIGTLTSDGNSMAAMMSAQAILDARMALMDAIEAAKADKMEAEAAKADTDDADVLTALDDAISDAETAIEAAEEVLGGDALAGYVDMVTGGDDADPMGTPTSVAKGVAEAVAMALLPTASDNGAAARAPLGTTAPAATVDDANKLETDDHKGMTWEMIVGADNVMSERVGTDNAARKLASVTGMTAADIDADLTATGGTNSDGKYADAFSTDSSSYKGIAGDVFCLGSDCEVNADGKLVGSWYFSPTSETDFFTKGADGMYSVEQYVQYGHWLSMEDHDSDAATPDVAQVNRFAVLTGTSPGDGSWAAGNPSATDDGLKASSATYSGMAVGRSVHKTLDGDGGVTDIQSGRFMADIMLTATFSAANSTLGGKVSGFTSPDNPGAVDPDWEVTLNAITTADGTVTAGVTEATGQNGVWTSDAYGATTTRPVGIFGGFNAHFSDGHAAGAYATRKD